jgi:hypothetical protein
VQRRHANKNANISLTTTSAIGVSVRKYASPNINRKINESYGKSVQLLMYQRAAMTNDVFWSVIPVKQTTYSSTIFHLT